MPHRRRVPDKLLEFARELRIKQTDAETTMWNLLRDRRLDGFKFRRQYPGRQEIVDFYCAEAKLAVELDGGQHNEDRAATKDAARTRALAEQGIMLLRFWNHEVLNDTPEVLERIWTALVERTSPHPPSGHPLP